MPRGGVRRILQHKCNDGQVRRIEPVYFQESVPGTDKRRFIRRAFFCYKCGYGSWQPVE
jgi:hypothetical protein